MPNSGMATSPAPVRRLRGDRGASLVEYALVFVFIAVGSLGVASYLTTNGDIEINNQADCVSRRPPPPSCQVRAVTPTTATTTVGVTTTIAPETTTTTTTTTTTAPPPTTVAPDPSATQVTVQGRPGPAVDAEFEVLSGTEPVNGATVRVRFDAITPNGPFSFEGACVTDATGTCFLPFDSPYNDATAIDVTVIQVTSNPASGPLPAPVTVTFP